MNESKLPAAFRFVELTNQEYETRWNEWGPKIFDEKSTILDTRKILSDEEKAQVRELNKNTAQLTRINIGVFKGEDFCGWFSGDQYNYETFYMRNSAILPQYRRQGLYRELMHEVLRRTKEMGFQIVLSRHTTTNNSIIIPKLKAGFVITAIEVSDRFGILVHLSYFFNSTRRKIMEFRSGDLKPDTNLKNAMGFQ
jgi:ribosomal protein S18 acetylase RimI-like enzyme